jgi:hypothetical protein
MEVYVAEHVDAIAKEIEHVKTFRFSLDREGGKDDSHFYPSK